MSSDHEREKAKQPNDIGRMFLERMNAGDVDGVLALYEPDAVLAFPAGQVAVGRAAIREVYERLLATGPTFEPGEQRQTLATTDLALTSTRLVNGTVTAEVARRQPDGSWLWALDQPDITAG